MHDGRFVRIQREPDNFKQIEPDYAMTSRPCPPYCVQPMQLAPGVETIGEQELLEYLKPTSSSYWPGYPAHKLKWYRDGMQGWKSLGLTTVPHKKP